MEDQEYIDSILQARVARDMRMKTNPQSWLALVGLYPLDEGANTFGSGSDNRIVLKGMPSERCGAILLKDRVVTLALSPSAGLTVNGREPEQRPLHNDHDPDPDLIGAGSLTMRVLMRGDRYYLRVWDSESNKIKEFTTLNYYPVDVAYRIHARFVAYDPPRIIKTQDAIGGNHDTPLVGEARFSISGVDCMLVAEGDEEEVLFSFVDETRRDATYPGGRFISMARPQTQETILDFNQALNWPCAYTDYATCPIPPAENHLKVRIEAGEKRFTA